MYNQDSVIIKILNSVSDFWQYLKNYSIFSILIAIVLLCVLCLTQSESADSLRVILNVVFLSATAAIIYKLLRFKVSDSAAFIFAAALVLRLSLAFVLETSTPLLFDEVRDRTNPWNINFDTVLFQPDEYFYLYHGQVFTDWTLDEFMNSPYSADHSYRASFVLSKVFNIFGEQTVWPRVVGAFLSAFAAVFIYLSVAEFGSRKACNIISLFTVIAPQTLFYSEGFLKEVWVIFASAMMLYGLSLLIKNKSHIICTVLIAVSAAILLWIRIEYGFAFLLAVPMTFFFRTHRTVPEIIFASLGILVLLVVVFVFQYSRITHKTEYIFDKYTDVHAREEANIAALDKIYESKGFLRLANIPLSILNPPPRNLHYIYTAENGFYDIAGQAAIYQWWLALPFAVIGGITIFSTHRKFISILVPYILAVSVSAMLLGGLQPNLLRYRDSLAPILFFIAALGVHSVLQTNSVWMRRIVYGTYLLFILLTGYFYIR